MKVLTSDQIRALDAYTIQHEPVLSIDLMERAATACTDYISNEFSEDRSFLIVCGQGNNGGDGLAIARQLHLQGRVVSVVVVQHATGPSSDFRANLDRLQALKEVPVVELTEASAFPPLEPDTLILDAILGTGITKPLHGLIKDIAARINRCANTVLSIDMPTGLWAESNQGNDLEDVLRANITLTFHCPKLSFLFPDTGPYVGTFEVLDIGLMEDEMGVGSPFEFVEPWRIAAYLRPRTRFSHKGTYGHALLMAGSKGKMGAAQLAAQACLRAGVGLVTAHVPACGLEILQIGVPEAMCSVDPHPDRITVLPELEKFAAIGIGPGIGAEPETANVLKALVQGASVKLVIDADAINLLGMNGTWVSFIPNGSILTPHPKEFERLLGESWESGYDCLQMQRRFSEKHGVILVLKGAHTCVTTPAGQVFFNSSGNTGMATAGSGDVLTGIILGLLAQGLSAESAAVLGVYLHGSVGDLARKEQSEESMIAGDLIGHLGAAFTALRNTTR